jgi:hypothetical protein
VLKSTRLPDGSLPSTEIMMAFACRLPGLIGAFAACRMSVWTARLLLAVLAMPLLVGHTSAIHHDDDRDRRGADDGDAGRARLNLRPTAIVSSSVVWEGRSLL